MEGIDLHARNREDPRLRIGSSSLESAWGYFRRSDLHKLSAVDATSFAIMRQARIRIAYTFDHFAVSDSGSRHDARRRPSVEPRGQAVASARRGQEHHLMLRREGDDLLRLLL